MRSKRAALNSICAIIAEIVSVICGFILPRLILSTFGSKYNGITSSITQFLSYVVLLRAGIGGVTRAALYKPLAEHDNFKLSGIVNATQAFMSKISLIYLVCAVAFAFIYPFFVKNEFDWMFSFSLVLILSISFFAQNYFGITYSLVIEADQRGYIYSILTVATTILNTVVACFLILAGASIHVVKLCSAIVFAANPIFLSVYTKKKYKIDKSVPKDNIAIKQRWDAFAQQFAAFINNNTDVVILTVASNLSEVSVYTIYHMVVKGLNGFQNAIVNSFEPVFGDLLARNEKEKLDNGFRTCEFICFSIATFIWMCAGMLIVSFVMVYTNGITDVSYYRPIFAILICISAYLNCTRMPYVMIVSAIGHFRQIRTGAIITPIINIVISVVLVPRYGVDGVMVGTIASMLFMNVQYSIYASRNILHRTMMYVLRNFLISIVEIGLSILLYIVLPLPAIKNYTLFFVDGTIYAVIVFAIIILVSFVLCKNELFNTFQIVRGIIKRGMK